MSAEHPRLDAIQAYNLLMGAHGQAGIFEQAIGFRATTHVIKPVHIMNDLAQSVLGVLPEHQGDLLCSVIRLDAKPPEDNSDSALRNDPRLGPLYAQAFPLALGQATIEELRAGVKTILNADKGIYKAGDSMASGLATHWTLLGAEGFRRFGVGAWVAALLDEPGQEQLSALFCDERDPVSRALAPLRVDARAEAKQWERAAQPLTALDEALSRGLQTLMAQPMSKLAKLRCLALASCMGACLKLLGVGQPGGRPTLLATPIDDEQGRRALREPATEALKRSITLMDQGLARLLEASPGWESLKRAQLSAHAPAVELPGVSELDAADVPRRFIQAMRSYKKLSSAEVKERDIYWPEQFAYELGKKIGFIGPRKDQAGWGKYATLTADLVEVLLLMVVPHDAPPRGWREVWTQVREELGIIIGADEYTDSRVLEAQGVKHLDLEALGANSDIFLQLACQRGVARRLPDQGAEVGGGLL